MLNGTPGSHDHGARVYDEEDHIFSYAMKPPGYTYATHS